MSWSPEAKEAARQRCLQNKPWLKSTGPKTPAGKAVSSVNSFKHGHYSSSFVIRAWGRDGVLKQEAEIQFQKVRELLAKFTFRESDVPEWLEDLIQKMDIDG